MKKYRIRYKGLDQQSSVKGIEKTLLKDYEEVTDLFISLDQEINRNWRMFRKPYQVGNYLDFIVLGFNEYEKLVEKNIIRMPPDAPEKTEIMQAIKLTKEELEYFDKRGFELTESARDETGQHIEDWYLEDENL